MPVSYVELQSSIVAVNSTQLPLPPSTHSYRLSDYAPPDPANNCLSYPFLFHSPLWRKQFRDVQECHSRNYRSKPSSVAEVEKSCNEYLCISLLYPLGPTTARPIIPFMMACHGSMVAICVLLFPIRMWRCLRRRKVTSR